MPAFQAVVRHVVIKCFPAELHDISVAAEMIPVACATSRTTSAAQPVKPALRLDVLRYFIMTVQAQRTLAFLAEWSMTFPAFLLVPGMSIDELSRHHQWLDINRMCRFRHCKHHDCGTDENNYKIYLHGCGRRCYQ
jgi:hypothetical protein